METSEIIARLPGFELEFFCDAVDLIELISEIKTLSLIFSLIVIIVVILIYLALINTIQCRVLYVRFKNL